ncbi:MAG: BON domain-containing protein [Cyclobacteriaceae bacterium]|nr:BON domain-containing protein [Cyclobacteriaceae bacterium]
MSIKKIIEKTALVTALVVLAAPGMASTPAIALPLAGQFAADENQGDVPADQDITYFIQREYMVQEAVNWNNVDVSTREGIVTLSGNVNNLLAKDRAISIAKSVKGVRAVLDKVNVSGLQISDEQLKANIEKSLKLDPATEQYEIGVSVVNGKVDLSGKVQSWQEKMLADKVARSVKGVKAVENNVYFDFTSNRSDAEIREDVMQSLRWDVRVDDGLINVEVKDGIVNLSGTVGSATEQSQAEVDAWVAGVKHVNTDRLTISKWARNEAMRKDKYVSKSDDEIEKAIKDVFLYDPRVLSFNPDVAVDNQTVTLTGAVDNLKAKNAAERDARNVVGVRKVVNLLKVRAETRPKDNELRTKVLDALALHPVTEKSGINVSVNDGVVTLFGAVENNQLKYEAAEIASGIRGISEVKNLLTPNADALPYAFDYHTQYYYPYYFGQYDQRYRPAKSDWEIKEDIEDQIWWSPFVNKSDVEVNVEDGVAELSGTVDSWNEYRFAEKNAFDGGASRSITT